MAILTINGITLELKRTWLHKEVEDERSYVEDGERCGEFVSVHGKYKLVTTMDSVADLLK